MTAIERTAYPRLRQEQYRKRDLALYVPTQEELQWMDAHRITQPAMRLNLMVQLKTFQRLGYFAPIDKVPGVIISAIRKVVGSPARLKACYPHKDARYNHRKLIREYLMINTNNDQRDRLINTTAKKVAQTMNDPADIINQVVEELIHHYYELPAFSSLDRTVCHIRENVNQHIFKSLYQKLQRNKKLKMLQQTLVLDENILTPDFHRFKQLPVKPTIKNFKELVLHHNWLMSFGDFNHYLKDISKIKVAQFAEEAKTLDTNGIRQMRDDNKRYSLMACLLAKAQHRAKDALGQTFNHSINKSNKDALLDYAAEGKHREDLIQDITEFALASATHYKNKKNAEKFIATLIKQYKNYGGEDKFIEDCEKLLLVDTNKHLPRIWEKYKSKRHAVYAFFDAVEFAGVATAKPLLEAVKLLGKLRQLSVKDKEHMKPDAITLSFVPRNWLSLVASKNQKTLYLQHFEVCVMLQLREHLKNGDIYIIGADIFGDYRKTLLPWETCLTLLPEFCEATKRPQTGKEAVSLLRKQLTERIRQLDKDYLELSEFVIGTDNIPVLKKRFPNLNPFAIVLRDEIKSRMPERNLLDILCLGHHATEWAYCFSPISGSDPKISDPIGANIVTTFAYGTGMGPTQTAKHVRAAFSAKNIGYINKSYVTLKKLNAALVRVINYYKGFPLIDAWGTGEACAVDGTLINIFDQNLLSEMHIRYGKRGGIAYHHISDTYIALFSSLIPCGVWEATAIIEGLMKNESEIKPTRIHGDTQAQSTPVFSFAYLFGIDLMPRIRNWKDLTLYKPNNRMQLNNIGSLFSDTIDWSLIEDNWQDMMQVILSIKYGKVSSELILNRLGSKNKSSQLYKGFSELGKVIRTLFLLRYIAEPALREDITAQTNKVESYNNLSDWVSFASRFIVASNDTTEMEKAIKYNTLIANLVILQNVIDMSRIIQQLRREGWSICEKDLARLSPYLTEHLKGVLS